MKGMIIMKQGKTTIRKISSNSYEVSNESTLQSIASDIVTLFVVSTIIYNFAGKSILLDILAIALIIVYLKYSIIQPNIITKKELLKELEEIE